MINFIISKNDKTIEINCDLEGSILSLKKKIIDQFNLECQYIDIDFQLERPIRSLGKFNLESGIIPRTLDNYPFDRYGLDGKTVNATFNEVDNYQPPQKYSKKFVHSNYSEKKERSVNKVSFNLDSDTDFPSLS